MVGRNLERLTEKFSFIPRLNREERERFSRALFFPVLEAGQVAYTLDAPCPNYLMCLDGRTRVFKTSDSGREILIYKVGGGGTCALTTQCLFSNTTFPAESIAETRTQLAALPAPLFRTFIAEMPVFRDFVLSDYTQLLGTMLSFVDALAFQTIEQRLARRLLVEAGEQFVIEKTHQQIASDIGSVREIVSRQLGNWEKKGWISVARGKISILDRGALAVLRSTEHA